VPEIGQDSGPPRQFPSVPPQDLYPTSDIRFVMVELGKVGAKLDRLIEDVGKHSQKIDKLDTTLDRVRTGAIVATVLISGVATLFWWMLGERITAAVKAGLFPAAIAERAPQQLAIPPAQVPIPSLRRQ
jgi:hypothetical protein